MVKDRADTYTSRGAKENSRHSFFFFADRLVCYTVQVGVMTRSVVYVQAALRRPVRQLGASVVAAEDSIEQLTAGEVDKTEQIEGSVLVYCCFFVFRRIGEYISLDLFCFLAQWLVTFPFPSHTHTRTYARTH